MFSTTSLRKLDVGWGIPRPADRQHYSSWRAAYAFAGAVAHALALVTCGAVSAALIWGTFTHLGLFGFEWRGMAAGLGFVAVALGVLEAVALALPYYRVSRLESHGNQAWATAEELRAQNLIAASGAPRPPGFIQLGAWGHRFRRYRLVLPLDRMFWHLCIFGPPGSGKSKSFFMSIIRQWSAFGCVMALDTKGELYRFCGRFFDNVFRLDLEEPTKSDRLNIVGACQGNPEYAHEVAATIVGFDAHALNNAKEPFWPLAETALLKALLMYVAMKAERPHPGMICQLLARLKGKKLGEALEACGDPCVADAWRVFAQAKPDLQASVRIGLSVLLEPFATPHVQTLFTPPSDEERAAGVRELELDALRTPSLGVFLVVAEGKAVQLEVVIATIFGLAQAVLRRTGSAAGDADVTPALVALDEVGNIRIRHLSERIGVGRGLRTCYLLGYQNINQAFAHFGHDGANAIFESIRTFIFLPGLGEKTAEFASRALAKTTTWSTQTIDAVGRQFDQQRITEISRSLMDPADVRQMLEYVEALFVHGTVPPAKFAIPPCVTRGPLLFARDYAIDVLPATGSEAPPSAAGLAAAAAAVASAAAAGGNNEPAPTTSGPAEPQVRPGEQRERPPYIREVDGPGRERGQPRRGVAPSDDQPKLFGERGEAKDERENESE